jgi:hypothetical protein
MDEATTNPKSYTLYAFTGFLSLNLLYCTQVIGVKSLTPTHALLPLTLCLLLSAARRLLIILNSRQSLVKSLTQKYHLMCAVFFFAALLAVNCFSTFLDLQNKLSAVQAENRRKERGGLISDDDEGYDTEELKLAERVDIFKTYAFGGAYLTIVAFALVYF